MGPQSLEIMARLSAEDEHMAAMKEQTEETNEEDETESQGASQSAIPPTQVVHNSNKALENKLKSQLGKLEHEQAVFERMVYKNKNQHRRCSYFQYLLKVRRDLKLLRTSNVEEIFSSCFHVIYGKRTKQKIHVLESLKLKKTDTGRPNILERLLGALHLLSQWDINSAIARSFFVGFSMTFLALLARLRVLVQQILLDAVSVFNLVNSTSLQKQSVKIASDEVENRESSKPIEGDVSEDTTTRVSLVQYQTSVSFLREDVSPYIAESAFLKSNNAFQPEE